MKKIFYGWVVVAAATATYFLAGGTRFGVFGVFLKPISDEFGWTRSATAGAASLGSMQGAIEGPVIGVLADKYGPRKVMWGGFLLAAVGFVVLGFTQSILMFYIAFVPLISLGFGAVQLPGQTAVGNWFMRKRSRAFAILTTGFALGGAALTPGISWLVENHGWRTAGLVIGLVVAVVGIGVTFLMRRSPEDSGQLPDGDPPPDASASLDSDGGTTSGTNERPGRVEYDFTFKEALATRSFWLLNLGFLLSQLAVSAVMVHSIPLLSDRGMSAQVAANYVGLSAFWGMAGRILWGGLGDFVPKQILLALAVVVQGAGMLALVAGESPVHLHAFALLYGVGQGIVPVTFAIRGEYFGRKAFGTIAGVMQAFQTIGGVAGPIYAGWAYDLTQSYTFAFTVLALASLVAVVAFVFAPKPGAPKTAA